MDWSVGSYERVAEGLQPASAAVIEHAAPAPGERLLDIGCGTGNASLLAVERGARVTGVDPAARLLGVARELARLRGCEIEFIEGTAEALPVAEASADVAVSVFGVIFATDPSAAAREISRVTAPHGRLVTSAWLPSGAIAQMGRMGRAAIAAAAGTPAGPPPFAWHDPDALSELLEPHGFSVELHEHFLPFTAASPEAFLDEEMGEHPVWVSARGLLESRGELASLRESVLGVLRDANEDPQAFQVTSRYVVAVAARGR
jgi:SAM-dependent methyltransferase